jgi:hypothetical protein
MIVKRNVVKLRIDILQVQQWFCMIHNTTTPLTRRINTVQTAYCEVTRRSLDLQQNVNTFKNKITLFTKHILNTSVVALSARNMYEICWSTFDDGRHWPPHVRVVFSLM